MRNIDEMLQNIPFDDFAGDDIMNEKNNISKNDVDKILAETLKKDEQISQTYDSKKPIFLKSKKFSAIAAAVFVLVITGAAFMALLKKDDDIRLESRPDIPSYNSKIDDSSYENSDNSSSVIDSDLDSDLSSKENSSKSDDSDSKKDDSSKVDSSQQNDDNKNNDNSKNDEPNNQSGENANNQNIYDKNQDLLNKYFQQTGQNLSLLNSVEIIENDNAVKQSGFEDYNINLVATVNSDQFVYIFYSVERTDGKPLDDGYASASGGNDMDFNFYVNAPTQYQILEDGNTAVGVIAGVFRSYDDDLNHRNYIVGSKNEITIQNLYRLGDGEDKSYASGEYTFSFELPKQSGNDMSIPNVGGETAKWSHPEMVDSSGNKINVELSIGAVNYSAGSISIEFEGDSSNWWNYFFPDKIIYLNRGYDYQGNKVSYTANQVSEYYFVRLKKSDGTIDSLPFTGIVFGDDGSTNRVTFSTINNPVDYSKYKSIIVGDREIEIN